MSTPPPPLDPFQQQQQQPPPMVMAQQQSYTAHSGHGSVGPFIAVLAVITILGAIAVMIGRLCSGRGIMGHGHYDFESWVETKCSSCIDGRIETPMPRRVVEHSTNSGSGESPPAAAATTTAEEADQETKEEEASVDPPGHHHQHHHHHQPNERVES